MELIKVLLDMEVAGVMCTILPLMGNFNFLLLLTHVLTIPRCYFTFNGQGEYTLIEAWSEENITFTMQARTLPFYLYPGATLTQAVCERIYLKN